MFEAEIRRRCTLVLVEVTRIAVFMVRLEGLGRRNFGSLERQRLLGGEVVAVGVECGWERVGDEGMFGNRGVGFGRVASI